MISAVPEGGAPTGLPARRRRYGRKYLAVAVLESTRESLPKIHVVIKRDEEDNYVATVTALRGYHTQAKNLDTLMKRVREVIQLCLEDNQAAPTLELVGIQQISL